MQGEGGTAQSNALLHLRNNISTFQLIVYLRSDPLIITKLGIRYDDCRLVDVLKRLDKQCISLILETID